MKKTKQNYAYYAVTVGSQVGVFKTWHEAKQYVEGYSGALYKGYHTYKEAKDAFDSCNNGLHESKNDFKWSFSAPPRGNNC